MLGSIRQRRVYCRIGERRERKRGRLDTWLLPVYSILVVAYIIWCVHVFEKEREIEKRECCVHNTTNCNPSHCYIVSKVPINRMGLLSVYTNVRVID